MNSSNALVRAGVVAASVLLATGTVIYRQELSTWAGTMGVARADATAGPVTDAVSHQVARPPGEKYAAAMSGNVREEGRAARTAHRRPDTPEVAPVDPGTLTADTAGHRRIMFSGSKSGPMIPEPSTPTSAPQSAASAPATAPTSDSIREMMMSRSGPMIAPSAAAHNPASTLPQPSAESLARWRALLAGPRFGTWTITTPQADSSRLMNGTKSLPRRIDSPVVRYAPRRATEDRFRNRTVDSSGTGTRAPHR